MRDIRIFVSSPGDVAAERTRLDWVIDRLNASLPGLRLQSYRWEEGQYFSAHDTFQTQIPDTTGFDLVVGIVWSRIGTPPPESFPRMPDGRAYPSGTAFEILSAIRHRRESGEKPDILFYRKRGPLALIPGADDLARTQRDVEALESFMAEWFFNTDDGFIAAFDTFVSTDDFAEKFESHLRAWLASRGLLGRERLWRIEERGSPFAGLSAFDARMSDVFFGRSREILRARELQAAARRPFLLIEGASGTGKSSLARAGLVPDLMRPRGGEPARRAAVMVPDADPCAALADALAEPDALPEVTGGDFSTPALLAEFLRSAAPVTPILAALDRAAEALRLRTHAAERPPMELVLLVDQLEQLFAANVPEAVRDDFLTLVARLVDSGRVRVLATLRADAGGAARGSAVLAGLLNEGATLTLPPPGAAERAEIVRRPAEVSGIAFERRADGVGLDEVLLDEAGETDALPLLQFALARVYAEAIATATPPAPAQAGTADADEPVLVLRHADYERIGRMSGAIRRAAEEAVRSEPGAALRDRLRPLMRQLLAVGPGGVFVLRDAAWGEIARVPETRRLAEALVEGRILVRDRGRVRLAHQRVLDAWPEAGEAARREFELIRVRDAIAEEAGRWEQEGRPAGRLLQGVRLAEAIDAWRTDADLLAPQAEFVRRSRARARRAQTLTAAAAALFLAVAGGAGWFFVQAERNAVAALASAEEARQQGERAVASEASARAAALQADEARVVAEAARAHAETIAAEATARRWTALAEQALERNPGETAAAAMVAAQAEDLHPTPEAGALLRRALALAPAVARPLKYPWVFADVAGSADGRVLALSRLDTPSMPPDEPEARAAGLVLAADLSDAARVSFSGAVRPIASPDGRRIAFAGASRRIEVVDVASGARVSWPTRSRTDAVFSPDASRLYVVDETGDVEVRAAPDWAISRRLDLPVENAGARLVFVDVDAAGERLLVAQVPWQDAPRAFVVSLDDGSQVELPLPWDPLEPVVRQSRVTQAGMLPSGRMALTRHDDGVMRVWNAATGALVHALSDDTGRRSEPGAQALSPDETRLAAGARDGRLSLWSLETGNRVANWDTGAEIRALAYAADGARLVVGTAAGLSLRDAADARVLWEVPGDVRFATVDASGTTAVAALDADRLARIDIATGAVVAERRLDARATDLAGARDGVVGVGLLDSDARAIWTDIDVVAARTEETIAHVAWPGALESITLSPDGARLAARDRARGETLIWDTASAELVARWPFPGHPLRFSDDGAMLVARAQALELRRVDDGARLATLGEPGGVASLHGAPFSDRVTTVTTGADREAVLWDLADVRELARLRTAALPSDDGARFASFYDADRRRIEAVDILSGTTIASLPFGEGPVAPVLVRAAISPDGRLLLAARPVRSAERGAPGHVLAELWDLEAPRLVARRTLPLRASNAPLEIGLVPGGLFAVSGLSAMREGHEARLLVVRGSDGAVAWDARAAHTTMLRVEAVDRRTGAVAIHTEGAVELRDGLTGELLHAIPARAVAGVAFDDAGRVTAVADPTRGIVVLDRQSGRTLIVGEPGGVRALAVTADGARIVAAARGASPRRLTAWSAETGAVLAEIEMSAPATRLLPVSDPVRIAVRTEAATVEIFDLDTGTRTALLAPDMLAERFELASRAPRAVTLASASIRLWDTQTGREIARRLTESPVAAMALSPDGRRFAYLAERPRTSADARPYRELVVWTPEEAARLATGPAVDVEAVAFDPAGARLVLIGASASGAGANRRIQVLDAATLVPLLSVATLANGAVTTAREVGFSGDGRHLLIEESGADATGATRRRLGMLRAISLETGEETVRADVTHPVHPLAAGEEVIYGDTHRRLRRASLRAAAVDPVRLETQASAVEAIGRDGALLLWGRSSGAAVVDPRTGMRRDLLGPDEEVDVLAVAVDGRHGRVALSVADRRGAPDAPGAVRVYDAATGDEIARTALPRPAQHVAFAGTNLLLAARREDGGYLVRWDTDSGALDALVEGAEVERLTVSEDGRIAAHDQEALDPASGQDRSTGLRVWRVADGVEIARLDPLGSGHRLSLSADGRLLSAVGDALPARGAVYRIDVDADAPGNPEPVRHLPALWTEGDGRPLGFPSPGRLARAETAGIRLVDLASGDIVRLRADGRLRLFAQSPDGRHVAAAGDDVLYVWDLEADRRVAAFPFRDPADLAFGAGDRLFALRGERLHEVSWRGPELVERACVAYRTGTWQFARARITTLGDDDPCEPPR